MMHGTHNVKLGLKIVSIVETYMHLFTFAETLSSEKVIVGIHKITAVIFPVVKRPGLKADHSPQSSAEVKNDFSACTGHLNPHVLENIRAFSQQQQQQRRRRRQ